MANNASDWEHIRKVAVVENEQVPGWPPEVRPISTEGLSLLGIDREMRLYWDGHRLARHFELTKEQAIGAGILALGALLGGVGALLSGIAALSGSGGG